MIVYGFFNDDKVLAAFSERSGGVSPLPENALNLSFSREPGGNRDNVMKNHAIAADTLGIDVNMITRMPQLHGDNILVVDRELAGSGITKPFPPGAEKGYDGMVTNVPGAVLSTSHADCVPVLLYDPVKKAVGAVHSGWKGTCLKISAAAVKKLEEAFGSRPEDVKAIIGPAICMDHFEVRKDVADRFTEAFGDADGNCPGTLMKLPRPGEQDPKWHVDMRGFVKLTLTESGLKEDNIFVSEDCTFGEPERFFSHRRDGAMSGAMASFICLKG